MCRVNTRSSAVVLLVATLLLADLAHSQICEPTPDGVACTPTACSAIPENQCLATALRLDIATGAVTTEACACQDFNLCHVVAGNASFFAEGICPIGNRCALVSADVNNDGVPDRFTSACLPDSGGICCLDIDDGPLAYDTCAPSEPNVCNGMGGVFHDTTLGCQDIQACCLSSGGGSFCQATLPECCVDSGGVPLGPGSTCDPNSAAGGCPQRCGGIAGVLCAGANEFCMLPPGGCCCDFMGVCMVPPAACPTLWDPVCGCDGQTYSNACEAARASMSIDHRGVCDMGACCLTNAAAGSTCVIATLPACLTDGGTFLGVGTTCPPDPSLPCGSPTGACCVRISPLGPQFCFDGTVDECAAAGGSFAGEGTSCSDPTTSCANPTGACCRPVLGAFATSCEETTEVTCTMSGGNYLGDGTICPIDGTNPCPPPTGACCVGDSTTNAAACFVGTAQDCANRGGSYLGDGTVCPPATDLPCGRPMGACCFAPPGTVVSTCAEMTVEMCSVIGGHYLGDGVTCPTDPALACPAPCPALCGVFECFAGCGTIVQGTECPLFQTTRGRFVLSDLGPFGVGDRVFVTGCLDPFCISTCLEGDGCIQNLTITACGDACGGIAGVPCSVANEFCNFPIGTCGNGDVPGICTPIPGNVCPGVFDPVCGCDGITYGNECEAAAASMSIAHRGACDMGQCAAARNLSDPDLTYCPGEQKTVHLVLNIPTGTTVFAVEDAPPPGWKVVAISDNGNFDTTNGKVKWGPFFAPFPASLTYVVIPAAVDVGPKCFKGVISIDGVSRDTCGDQCVDAFCRPFMPVDIPQPPCPNCPLSDCHGCDHGTCQDGQISLCEVISYACSWKTGCNDDLSGMTRAAFIWKNGECYCWDDVGQLWLVSTCPPPPSGLCSNLGPRGDTLEPLTVSDATATARFRVLENGGRGGTLSVRIMIQLHSPATVSAVALDFYIPPGWTVANVGSDGKWDETHRKVKWGPYFDDTLQTVFVTVRKALRRVNAVKRSARPDYQLHGFHGTVSFDGANEPVTIPRRASGVR